MSIRLLSEGLILTVEVSANDFSIDLNPPLVEQITAYFVTHETTVLLPVEVLINTKYETESIKNALARFRLASQGLIEKREPIDVYQYDEKFYAIIDGNATAIAANLANWPKLPCNIHSKIG